MTAAAHPASREDYSDALRALTGDVAPLAAVAALGLPAHGWQREYGRLHPGEEPFATVVMEHERSGAVACVEAFSAEPWLRASLPAGDARLPGLAAVAGMPGARVVRWRPHKRCTLRVGDRFAKAFGGRQGARIHDEAVDLRRSASRLGFAVAEPLGYDADVRVVWQRAIPGRPAEEAVLAGDDGLAERMGAAAATLARSGVGPRSTHDAALAVSKSSLRAAELAAALPVLEARVRELMRGLRAVHAAHSSPLAPVHGNFGLDHWLVDDGRLGVVDFDNFALGEPERDAASFVAELEPEAPESVGPAWLAGWEAAGGRLDRSLVGAYAAHRLLRKARLAAWSLKPRAAQRAARYLDRAIGWLEREGA